MKLVSTSYCFISLVTKWDCDLFHSFPLHISVKQFYQLCVQMRLWLISLTITTLSHPTVLWSWSPHPTVLSVFVTKWDCDSFHSSYLHFSVKQFYQFWWPNEIVTYFTHYLYTLVSNYFFRSQIVWCSNGTTTHTTLNVNVTTCLFIWTGIIVKFQKGNMCVKLAWLNT
jgi:hypothetical protein